MSGTHKLFVFLFLSLALALTLAFRGNAPTRDEIEVNVNTSWMLDRVWDDGAAQYAVYDAKWQRYERLNPGRVCMLVVKEPWLAAQDVKSEDSSAGDFDVLKFNLIRDVNTGVYTYEQMSSVFARRATGALRKYATASLEACGLTTAQMTKGKLDTHSYWGDQADRQVSWPDGAIPEDALPLYLRGILKGELPKTLLVFPSLMAGHLPLLEAVKFDVRRKPGVKVKTAAGTFETTEINLTYGEEVLTFQFSNEPGHVLVRYHDSFGTEYTLAKVERMPYWRRNAPKDESWWPKRLR